MAANEKHYVRLEFGTGRKNVPEIYSFFFNHMPDVLKQMGKREVCIDMERLEPIDRIYSNLDISEAEAQRVVDKFAKSHHLREHASLEASKSKTSLKATVPVKNLGALLSEYNLLFDMFFTDIVLRADSRLELDMQDGFSNSVLAFGERGIVEKFASLVKERLPKTRVISIDRPDKKSKRH